MECANLGIGTTSACAENTQKPGGKKFLDRNYLRVRGEYYHMGKFHCAHLELPPRARRILAPEDPSAAQEGTTSACAENTIFSRISISFHWNYLRVRGEYGVHVIGVDADKELPPRARRIPLYHHPGRQGRGTTSACAENTYSR